MPLAPSEVLRNSGDFSPILCNPFFVLQDLTSAGMPSLTPEEVRTAAELWRLLLHSQPRAALAPP